MKKQFFVYILTNYTNRVLYTGITNNLKVRVYIHKNKLTGGFTGKYNVSKLVYYEVFNEPETAIKREKAIKNLLRKKKLALIERFNRFYRCAKSDLASLQNDDHLHFFHRPRLFLRASFSAFLN